MSLILVSLTTFIVVTGDGALAGLLPAAPSRAVDAAPTRAGRAASRGSRPSASAAPRSSQPCAGHHRPVRPRRRPLARAPALASPASAAANAAALFLGARTLLSFGPALVAPRCRAVVGGQSARPTRAGARSRSRPRSRARELWLKRRMPAPHAADHQRAAGQPRPDGRLPRGRPRPERHHRAASARSARP